jgi:hypothetical protein
VFERTFHRREQQEHTVSVPKGISWQPIPGQDFANVPFNPSMETDRGSFGIQSLASLGVQLTSIGGPPPLPC